MPSGLSPDALPDGDLRQAPPCVSNQSFPYISGPSLVLLLALKEVFLGVHRKSPGLAAGLTAQTALGLFLLHSFFVDGFFLGILYLAVWTDSVTGTTSQVE